VGDDFHALLPIHLEFPESRFVRVGVAPATGRVTVPVDLVLKGPASARPLAVRFNSGSEILARD
jgi:hypothetical protein